MLLSLTISRISRLRLDAPVFDHLQNFKTKTRCSCLWPSATFQDTHSMLLSLTIRNISRQRHDAHVFDYQQHFKTNTRYSCLWLSETFQDKDSMLLSLTIGNISRQRLDAPVIDYQQYFTHSIIVFDRWDYIFSVHNHICSFKLLTSNRIQTMTGYLFTACFQAELKIPELTLKIFIHICNVYAL